ncbi:tetratricopeptide repeat protein [Bradyrhizobium oligotrophicum]|uniref:tetratricopeptide repeat protein n=1 Tax=Bradyrhizobium oligotrophicum TaxID=44255 RepID=UPI003EC05082
MGLFEKTVSYAGRRHLLFAGRIAGGALAIVVSGLQPAHTETVTGTGFAITFDGVIITNNHVISECDSLIKARLEGTPDQYSVATVIGRDERHDLAALRLQRAGSNQVPIRAVPRAILRKGPTVLQGEKAIAYGFPLRGLLATNGNLTLGNVSALSGIGDDHSYIQITTPVQPGNSGGPLYDGSGHIIGVVVAKLNALRVMLATGDVPQNVNFAVELGAVRQFLKQNRLEVAEEDSTTELAVPEIALKAKLSTYLIECEARAPETATPAMLPPLPPKNADVPIPAVSGSQQQIPVALSKLKFSDIRRPYPTLHPQTFEIAISNAGSDPVSEVTIAFRRVPGGQCSTDLNDYDGFKRFSVTLLPGDSTRVTGAFSAQAGSFCIVKALGPPVGLAACLNSNVTPDVGIAACSSAIRSGDIDAAGLVSAYIKRGNRYDDKEDLDHAIADYSEAIRLNPKLDYTLFRRCWAYSKKNQDDRAIADCSKSIALNPRFEGAYWIRAYSGARKGDDDQAISDFTSAIKLNGTNSSSFQNRAALYMKKGDFDLAIADYTAALKLNPSVADSIQASLAGAFRRRGQRYDEKGEHDRAVVDYSEAIRHSSNPSPSLLTRRGYSYQSKGEYDSAIGDYDEAIRMDPEYVSAYVDRGFAFFSKGQNDRAIVDYTEAIRIHPDSVSSYRNRGLAYHYAGAHAKAEADLEAAAKIKPNDPYIASWRELLSYQANSPSALIQTASQLDIAAWPGPIVKFLLGQITQQALFASTKDPDLQKTRKQQCEANFFVGHFELQRGSRDEAKRFLQVAARDCPRQFLEAAAATADLRALDSKR